MVKILLELHIAEEETKSGFSFDDCRELLEAGEWRTMEHVQICGIMMMASNTDDEQQIAQEFDAAYAFFKEVKEKYFAAFELATYGLVSGLLWRRAKHSLPTLYAVLLTAMVSGRIVWGIVRFVLAGLTGGSFPFSAFLSGALFTAVPGIAAQLVFIPLLLTALQKAGFAD